MPFTEGSGGRLSYERTGDGPRLLFCNASGVSLDSSRLLLGLFASHFDFVTFDYRGFGDSDESPTPYSVADCAQDALAVMTAVGWESARVMGISFGGMVAQEVAVTGPERVERLALLCTAPGGEGGSSYPLHELENLPRDEKLRALRRLVDTRFDDAWLAAHPEAQNLVDVLAGSQEQAPDPRRERARLAQLQARAGHNVWDRLPSINCPVFIGCGRFDGIAPPQLSEHIASRVGDAEVHVYEGGHLFVAQDPRAVPETVNFLTGNASPEP
jgi:pimeloyl-ACP methyl ester carboxylesterase